MSAGQIIGRVSVKVLPDTAEFRRDAQRKLTVIEKTLKMTVGTRIDMSGASREFLTELRKINQRNRNLDSRKIRFHTTISTDGMREAISKAVRQLQDKANGRKIKIAADLVAATAVLELDPDSLDRVRKELADFRKRHDPLKVMVHPQMVLGSTTVIEKRLGYLARPRRVPLLPHVNSTAAAKAATALAALSGARVIAGYFRDLANHLGRLDQNIPMIGSLALAIAGLTGSTIAAASNLASLSASLASIAPAALALPGILGGVAIGLGATVAVFKDFNKVIPEVKTQLATLQNAMSANFWAVAEAPIRNLIDTLLPQFSTGLKAVSNQLGGFFAALATAFTGVLDGALAGMFADLSASIAIATGATGALASIIKVLGETGTGYLPRLAQWFTDIANRFNAWLSAAASDGRLKAWIDNAITALGQLGSVLASVGSILAGIARAATAAGGSTLGSLADSLERIATVVNGPTFQQGLTGVFAAAHEAMHQIATISGPAVESLFLALATTLQTVLPMAGAAIGELLGAVAASLAQPAFQGGLVSLFEGIKAAVSGLAPAFGPLGVALGALGGVIGTFLTILGPTLGVVFTALGNAIAAVAPAVNQLVTVLGGALNGALTAVAPSAQQLVTAFAGLISGGLIPALTTAFNALVPAVSTLAPLIGQVLVTALQAITPLLPIIGNLLAAIAPILAQFASAILPVLGPLLTALGTALGVVLTAVTPLIAALLRLAVSVIQPLIVAVMQVVTAALPKLGEALSNVITAIQPLITALQAVVDFLMPILVPAIRFVAEVLIDSLISAINGVARVFTGVINIIQGVWNIFAGIFTGDWGRVWEGIQQVFSGIIDTIVGVFQVALNVGILGVAKKGLALLKGLWDNTWGAIKALASSVWGGLRSAWDNFLAALKNAPGAALSHIKALFSEAWSTIKTGAQLAWDGVRSFFVNGVRNAANTLKELPGKASAALGDLGSTLVSAGKRLIQGLINGIVSMFGAVKGKLSELTSKLSEWKGPESLDRVLLVGAGQLVIDGFIKGLESRYDAVRKSLSGLTADVAAMRIDAPAINGVVAPRLSSQVRGAISGAVSGEGHVTKVLNYYAAPNASLSAEEDLFAAAGRARMVGW